MLTRFLEKVNKSVQKSKIFGGFCPIFLKVQAFSPPEFAVLQRLLSLTSFSRRHVIKHTFETKNLWYYQNYKNVILKQCSPMNPLLFHPEKKHFRCSKKGLKYIMAQKEGGTYSKRTTNHNIKLSTTMKH